MLRSMCSCGIGIGLDRGNGIREELLRRPCPRYTGDVLRSGFDSTAISLGVRKSNQLTGVSSSTSSCLTGDCTRLFLPGLTGGISGGPSASCVSTPFEDRSSLGSRLVFDLLAALVCCGGSLIPASCIS